jgi:ParB/RepB/Spo0J family partition protein
MVGVDKLIPNPWNPNKMSELEFQELVAEVKHIKTIAKPIVVRRVGDMYQIVDGEHNWRAAQEAGLTEVPVTVEAMDDFEAMRQTLKRNQHGHHDPLAEGEMFAQMKKAKNFSNRQLAEEITMPEATIRNKLKYVEALELRKACAPDVRKVCAEDDRKVIAGFSIEQADTYLKLPAGFRDRWLDAGAIVKFVKQTVVVDDQPHIAEKLLELIDSKGLIHLVQADHNMQWSLEAAGRLALWCWDHVTIRNVSEYVIPVGELRLPMAVLDCLPCQATGKNKSQALLKPAQWAGILRNCKDQTTDKTYQLVLIRDAVQSALKAAGHDPIKTLNPRTVKMLAALGDAADFIRDAEFLSVEERFKLHQAKDFGYEEFAETAKEMAVEEFRRRRVDKSEDDDGESPRYEGGNVLAVYRECLEELKRRHREDREESMFENASVLRREILNRLQNEEAIRYGIVGSEPAIGLLASHLNKLDFPSLTLLGAALSTRYSKVSPAARWLQAAGGMVSLEAAQTVGQQPTKVSLAAAESNECSTIEE